MKDVHFKNIGIPVQMLFIRKENNCEGKGESHFTHGDTESLHVILLLSNLRKLWLITLSKNNPTKGPEFVENVDSATYVFFIQYLTRDINVLN